MSGKGFWSMCIVCTIISLLTAFVYICPIKTESDIDRLYNKLENRKGTIVIEISESVVIDTETGDGETTVGEYYIHHEENKYKNGQEMVDIFIYNPLNNGIDDILFRCSFAK
jgi:hypothetical protein